MLRDLSGVLTYGRVMKQCILTLALSGFVSLSAYAGTLNVVPLSADKIQAIAGHYSSTYGYVHVKPSQNGVFTDFKGRRITGVKKSDGFYYSTFRVAGIFPISLRLSLHRVDGLHRVSLSRHSSNKVVAQQFKATPISPQWMARLGEYRAKAVNGASKIAKVSFEMQQGVMLMRLNNGKYAYPLISQTATKQAVQKAEKLVRPTIGRPKQRTMEVWPEGQSLAAVIGNVRFKLDKR